MTVLLRKLFPWSLFSSLDKSVRIQAFLLFFCVEAIVVYTTWCIPNKTLAIFFCEYFPPRILFRIERIGRWSNGARYVYLLQGYIHWIYCYFKKKTFLFRGKGKGKWEKRMKKKNMIRKPRELKETKGKNGTPR